MFRDDVLDEQVERTTKTTFPNDTFPRRINREVAGNQCQPGIFRKWRDKLTRR